MLRPVAYATVFGRPILSGRGFLGCFVSRPVRNFRVPDPLDLFPLCEGKNVCVILRAQKNSMNSVAISVSKKKVSYFCELPNRDLTRTGYKCYIMVRVLTEPKKEAVEEDVEMPPADPAAPEVDYGSAEGGQPQKPPQEEDKGDKGENKWRLSGWEGSEVFLRDTITKPGVHPVDPIAICCKSDPIPLKDLDETWLRKRSGGWYGGHPILDALLKQQHDVMIDGNVQTVCRWAVMYINEHF